MQNIETDLHNTGTQLNQQGGFVQNTGSNTKHGLVCRSTGIDFAKTRGLICSDLPADGEAAWLDASAERQPRSHCHRALAIAAVNYADAVDFNSSTRASPPLRWCASISPSTPMVA